MVIVFEKKHTLWLTDLRLTTHQALTPLGHICTMIRLMIQLWSAMLKVWPILKRSNLVYILDTEAPEWKEMVDDVSLF